MRPPRPWATINLTPHCGKLIEMEAARLGVPQYRVVEMACSDVIGSDAKPRDNTPGAAAREMFGVARPEVP